MRILKWLVVGGMCVLLSPVYAQRNGFKPLVRTVPYPAWGDMAAAQMRLPFEQALRVGGLAYMVPNPRVGAEALHKGISSQVGVERPSFKTRLKRKAYDLFARRVSLDKLHALLERRLVQEPFPAYYVSFPRAWREFEEKVGGKLGTLEVILEAAYGPDARFDGCFLETYGEVVNFSKHAATAAGPLAAALARAYGEGMEKENGFFALRLQADAQHPQDVLLLDIKNLQNVHFISLRQSIGGEWMDAHWIEKEK